ncbi:hypothetical protein JCM9279_000529 [Rhodotorula babjevae]
MFYLPPLGQADLARLERFKGEDYAGYDEPFSAFVSVYLGIAWSTFLALVTSVDGLAGDNSPESLGCRNLMIVVARRHLYNVTRSRDPGLRIVDLPIWDTFSDAAENYVNRCINLKAQEAAPWTVAEPWRALNGLLRQDLVRHTLFLKQRQCQADILQEELGRLSILSFRRAIVEARRADLPQLAKDEIPPASRIERGLTIVRMQLWPTHKVLCRRDPDRFYLPPLTGEQQERLYALARSSSSAGCAIKKYLDDTEPPDDPRTAKHFRHAIQCDAYMGKVDEEAHLNALLMAYDCLDRAAPPDTRNSSRSPWEVFGASGLYYFSSYCAAELEETAARTRAGARDDRGVGDILADRGKVVVLNAILRQELVCATVRAQALRPSPRITVDTMLDLSILSKKRMLDVLERTDMSSLARERLKKECTDVLEGFVAETEQYRAAHARRAAVGMP